MNLLIIGASGFIGETLIDIGTKMNYNIVATGYKNIKDGFVYYNILYDDIMTIINNYQLYPGNTYVVICVGISKIDLCYENSKEAYKLNVLSTINLINRLNKYNYKFGFISTDAVFNGKKGYYNEQSLYSSETEYGKQKAKIEEYILDRMPTNLIFRISMLLDSENRKGNLLSNFYNSYIEKKPIYCLKNRIFCPTYVKDVANIILLCFEKNLNGLYNVANQEIFSMKELAELFISINSLSINVEEKDDLWFHFKDKRHHKTCLISEKLQKDIPYDFKLIEDIIKEFGLKNNIKKNCV